MRAFADFLVRLRKEKPLAVGLSVILLLLILVALLADVLAPFAPNEVFLMDRLQGSSAAIRWAPTSWDATSPAG